MLQLWSKINNNSIFSKPQFRTITANYCCILLIRISYSWLHRKLLSYSSLMLAEATIKEGKALEFRFVR